MLSRRSSACCEDDAEDVDPVGVCSAGSCGGGGEDLEVMVAGGLPIMWANVRLASAIDSEFAAPPSGHPRALRSAACDD